MYETRAENRQWLLDELARFRADPDYGRRTYAVWTARHGRPLPTDAVTPLPPIYSLIGIADGRPRPEDRITHDDRYSIPIGDLVGAGNVYRAEARERTFELRWLACLPGQLADHRYSILVQEYLDEHDQPLRIVHPRTTLDESEFGRGHGSTTVHFYPDEEGQTARLFFAAPQGRVGTSDNFQVAP